MHAYAHSIGMMQMAEPVKPLLVKMGKALSYSVWDRWDVDVANPTVSDVIDFFEQPRFQLDVDSIFYGPQIIYMSAMASHSKKRNTRLRDLIQSSGVALAESSCEIIVTFANVPAGVTTPPVRIHW
jgi:hypothetical protein